MKKNITKIVRKYLTENQIEQLKDAVPAVINNKIEGGFLTNKEAEDLQREIEANYSEGIPKFGHVDNDIRKYVFNYDNPLMEKDINGVNLRVAIGLIEGEPHTPSARKTYLLYADGKIIGKFYSVKDIKFIIGYIEDHLIKDIPNNKSLD